MADCPKMGRSTLQSPESNPWVQVGTSSPAAHGWAMPSRHGLPRLLKILRQQIESGPRVAHRVAGTRLSLHIAHQVAGLARTYPSSWGPAKEQPTTCLSSMSDLHELGIVTSKSRRLASYLTAYIYSPFCSALGVKWTWTEIFWIRKEDRFQLHGLFLCLRQCPDTEEMWADPQLSRSQRQMVERARPEKNQEPFRLPRSKAAKQGSPLLRCSGGH